MGWATRRTPSAAQTRLTVSKRGALSGRNALYKASRVTPADLTISVMPRARAMSPSAAASGRNLPAYAGAATAPVSAHRLVAVAALSNGVPRWPAGFKACPIPAASSLIALPSQHAPPAASQPAKRRSRGRLLGPHATPAACAHRLRSAKTVYAPG